MRKPKRKYVRKAEEVAVKELLPITQTDIDLLPPSLKMQLEAGTKMRIAHKIPDNLKERTEMMVRRFRGY